jgi:two-component system, OmpR family, KDP operon response regulator KdpE
MTLKILVADDEPQIRKQLKIGLNGYGYDVLLASNGQEALITAAQQSADMVILDINLRSDMDGIEVCRRLREWTQIPIIMLSVRDEEKTKVTALNAGADDYMTKPFGMEELHARMEAILRRTQNEPEANQTVEIQVGDLYINFVNRVVKVGGEEVHLTPKEYDLLRLLATHPGKVMTHRALLSAIWGPEYSNMDHYVRVFVNQLRKKLGEAPEQNIRYILNEPGVGYRFISDE